MSERTAHFLLRLGVAFAFLYPPIAAISDPNSWVGYFPLFVRQLPTQLGLSISALVLLHLFGILEAILAVWILSGWKIRFPAGVATLLLIAIVAFNWLSLDIVFRDLSIAAVSLALVFWPKPIVA